jgi:hypothetical protein
LSIRPVSCVPKVASFSGLSLRYTRHRTNGQSRETGNLRYTRHRTNGQSRETGNRCSLTFTYIAMLNNSTNNKTENYISPSLTEHKKPTYNVRRPGPSLGHAQQCGELNQFMGTQPSPLHKRISNGNTICKEMI